jgi:hypothetical protein
VTVVTFGAQLLSHIVKAEGKTVAKKLRAATRKEICADAGAVGQNRPSVAVPGEASQRESASGSDGDPGASGAGASPDGAGEPGTRTGQELEAYEQRRAACLKFIEQRHRAGDMPQNLLFVFSDALHSYPDSDICEAIDNEREAAQRKKAKSAAAGK